MRLRVATYNIHKCIGGLDRRYRPERVIEVLRASGADVFLLQEVDDLVPRSNWDRQVDLLGDALDMPHRAYFPNVRVRGGHYGNAVLARVPIVSARNIDLTLGWRKRRSALHAVLDGAGGPWHVFNLHLGLSERERRWQVSRLLEGPLSDVDGPTVVGGDLNDVFGSVRRRIVGQGGFVARPIPRTFPAYVPARALDGIYVRGAQLDRVEVVRGPAVRQASDHLPLVAEIRRPGDALRVHAPDVATLGTASDGDGSADRRAANRHHRGAAGGVTI